MAISKRATLVVKILGGILLTITLLIGAFIGLSIASMDNMGKLREFNEKTASLPTQLYDIKGRLITEFFSDEKRTLVRLDELPPHLIYAVITREDQEFFQHPGFSIKNYARAIWNIAIGNYVSGASTITQQLAGFIYANRATDRSLMRKVKELWYAIQLERNWSKSEILEEYLNKMPFGDGTYGVEAAAQHYFGHSAREVTIAESVILAIQLSSVQGKYSPLKNPGSAKVRQREILSQMVDLGYAGKADADASFDKYWREFDFTRGANATSAFLSRTDLAPYFSEYVRQELENSYLLGDADIYRDGFKIYTTLNLDYQAKADELMENGIAAANANYHKNKQLRTVYGEDNFIPVIDLLSLSLDIPKLRVGGIKQRIRAVNEYLEQINPVLDLVSAQFSYVPNQSPRKAVNAATATYRENIKRSRVEGAFVSIENNTGYITAMVGGSKFEASNANNRAVNGRLSPGSAFKPLYYAAGIEKDRITASTMLYDSQVVFMNADGSPYKPLNYKGEWKGSVSVRNALAHSMNVPSLKVLSRIDWNDAINIPARLLGLEPDQLPSRNFQMVMPYALGIVSVAPIEIAKAFATFPNQGREVDPIAIRYIEDRDGHIISEPEKIVREGIQKKGYAAQIISPQTAYIMTDLLQSVVNGGTLENAKSQAGGFTMPMGGKTGTPQNWSAAWTVGFSPYYTSTVWIGFDKGGNASLGTAQTGSAIAGPIWAKYMKAVHANLAPRRFTPPDGGITWVDVVPKSGLLPPPDYTGKTVREIFKVGTEPHDFDELTKKEEEQQARLLQDMQIQLGTGMGSVDASDLPDLSLDLDLKLNDELVPSPGVRASPDGASPSPQASSNNWLD
jgi:penicillin-binding protein 1A